MKDAKGHGSNKRGLPSAHAPLGPQLRAKRTAPPSRYHAGAVQAAIDASSRHGRKIGGREAKLIHGLLRGRR